MQKKIKGITLVELLLVIGILIFVCAITGRYIVSSFKDSNTVTNKVKIQTTVSVLMSNIEKQIIEADIPILTAVSDSGILAENDKRIEIRKPEGSIAVFDFNAGKRKVTYEVIDKEGNSVSKTSFENIIEFYVEKVQDNGLTVEIKAELLENTYELKNTYYTRNTISSSEI